MAIIMELIKLIPEEAKNDNECMYINSNEIVSVIPLSYIDSHDGATKIDNNVKVVKLKNGDLHKITNKIEEAPDGEYIFKNI